MRGIARPPFGRGPLIRRAHSPSGRTGVLPDALWPRHLLPKGEGQPHAVLAAFLPNAACAAARRAIGMRNGEQET
jgi:hypothetical protein